MKRSALLLLLSLGLLTAKAQVNVNVNVARQAPPTWVTDECRDVRYYYLPEIESYYDVYRNEYIVAQHGGWLYTPYLPAAYRWYNPYRGYKVALWDYYGPTPYLAYNDHQVCYPRHYRGPRQVVVYRPAPRVVVYQNHPGNGHGHGNGHYNNNYRDGRRDTDDRRGNDRRDNDRNDRDDSRRGNSAYGRDYSGGHRGR